MIICVHLNMYISVYLSKYLELILLYVIYAIQYLWQPNLKGKHHGGWRVALETCLSLDHHGTSCRNNDGHEKLYLGQLQIKTISCKQGSAKLIKTHSLPGYYSYREWLGTTVLFQNEPLDVSRCVIEHLYISERSSECHCNYPKLVDLWWFITLLLFL